MSNQGFNYVYLSRFSHTVTRLLLLSSGIFLFCFYLVSPSFSGLLSLEEQKDVWGGEQYMSVNHNGANTIPMAWPGNTAAMINSKIKADLQSGTPLPTATPSPALSIHTPTPSPTPFTLPADMQIMTVSTYLSESRLLHIKANEVWYEQVGYVSPGVTCITSINGTEWYPAWDETTKKSDAYSALNPALPQAEGFHYSIHIQQANGKVILVQEPTASNQFEAILLFDGELRIGLFNFELRWSTSPFAPPIQYPDPPYIYWRGSVISGSGYGLFMITIQDKKAEIQLDDYRMKAFTSSLIITDALPQKPVDITPSVLKGNVKVTVLQQPRMENNYQAKLSFRMKQERANTEMQIAITWKEVLPDPTPTPWPTRSPNAPTPTPASVPKVLWVVQQGMITGEHHQYDLDLDEFRDMFSALGAANNVIIAGSKTINSDMLAGYAAIIFGDTWNIPPATVPEQDAIVQYVRGGGSIFIMGGHQKIVPEPSSIYASSIGKPFGIEFSASVYGTYKYFERHILLSQVKSLNGGGSQLLVTPPAEVAGRASSGEAILAIANPDFGRVVAYSNEMSFYSAGALTGMDIASYSHKEFASNLAAWLLHKENTIPPLSPAPTPTPTYAAGPSDTEAEGLLKQVLKVNEPWLNPISANIRYSLSRNGIVFDNYTVNEGGPGAKRVGSLLYTPLHILYHKKPEYSIKSLGNTIYNGSVVSVLEITCNSRMSEYVGMGGQGDKSYSRSSNAVQAFRIFVDPQKAIPLFIGTSMAPFKAEQKGYSTTWTFSPDFFTLSGGYAPHVIIAQNDVFDERQTFQVVNGIWIYLNGEAWYDEYSSNGPGISIQAIELKNLVVDNSSSPVGRWMSY